MVVVNFIIKGAARGLRGVGDWAGSMRDPGIRSELPSHAIPTTEAVVRATTNKRRVVESSASDTDFRSVFTRTMLQKMFSL